ncbi:hypothetical protein HDU86_006112 [Geranomyces michiganensis]|nr:hypothetical protein HDU86_006112 [Geranomyces michiganensis]
MASSGQQAHHAQLEEWTDHIAALCGDAYALERTQILVDLRRTNDLLATVNRIYDGNFLEGTYLDPSYALILSSDIADDMERGIEEAADVLPNPGVFENLKGGWSSRPNTNARSAVDEGLNACRAMLQSDEDGEDGIAAGDIPDRHYKRPVSPLPEGGFIREASVTVLDSTDCSDYEPIRLQHHSSSSTLLEGGFFRDENGSPAVSDRSNKRRPFEEDQSRKRSKVPNGRRPPSQKPVLIDDSDSEDALLSQNARQAAATAFADARRDRSCSSSNNAVADRNSSQPLPIARFGTKLQRSATAPTVLNSSNHRTDEPNFDRTGRVERPFCQSVVIDSDSDGPLPPPAESGARGTHMSSQPVSSEVRRPLETVNLDFKSSLASASVRAGAAALNRFYGNQKAVHLPERQQTRFPVKATEGNTDPDEPPPLPPPRSYDFDVELSERQEINSNCRTTQAPLAAQKACDSCEEISADSDSEPGISSQSSTRRAPLYNRTKLGRSVPRTSRNRASDDSDDDLSVLPKSSAGLLRTQSSSIVRPAPPASSTFRRTNSLSTSTTAAPPSQTAIRALPESIIRASQQRVTLDCDSSDTELDEPAPWEAKSISALQTASRKGKERKEKDDAAPVKRKRSATTSAGDADVGMAQKEKAKAEKARLRAEKAQEMEEKKLAKQRETAARKAARSVNVIKTKTDCVKEMLVGIPHAFASPMERDLLVASLRELGAKAELVENGSNGSGNDRRGAGPRPPLIWRRQVTREWDHTADAWRACVARVEEEAYVLLRMTGPDVSGVLSGEDGDAPFVNFHERVQGQHKGKTIIYLLEGVKGYLKRRAKGDRGAAISVGGDDDETEEDVPAPKGRKRNVPPAATTTSGPLTLATLNAHLVALQLSTSLHPPDKLRSHPPPRVHLSSNFRESLDWIGSFTDQLSLAPELAHRSEAAWSLTFGDKIRCGDGPQDTFRRMLMMVNGITEARANTVVAAWGSLRRLQSEFTKLGVKNGRTLLATLQVNSGTAANPNVRNLGPAVARRIHDVFMETDPSLLLGG